MNDDNNQFSFTRVASKIKFLSVQFSKNLNETAAYFSYVLEEVPQRGQVMLVMSDNYIDRRAIYRFNDRLQAYS